MIGRFMTWGKAWQLVTNILKSSKNLCTENTNEYRVVSLEIQQKIQTANRCFFGLHKLLQKSKWADGMNSDSLALRVGDWTLYSRQADMEGSSSAGLNQVLVVVPHK
jgi:hypothetical protein